MHHAHTRLRLAGLHFLLRPSYTAAYRQRHLITPLKHTHSLIHIHIYPTKDKFKPNPPLPSFAVFTAAVHTRTRKQQFRCPGFGLFAWPVAAEFYHFFFLLSPLRAQHKRFPHTNAPELTQPTNVPLLLNHTFAIHASNNVSPLLREGRFTHCTHRTSGRCQRGFCVSFGQPEAMQNQMEIPGCYGFFAGSAAESETIPLFRLLDRLSKR